MRAKQIKREELYLTDDVIEGFGEVGAVKSEDGTIGWVLPGRVITNCREEAEHCARRLDRLIQANVKRYNRNLVW